MVKPGKRTYAFAWVIVILSALIGGLSAVVEQADALSIPLPWVAVLTALLAALTALMRDITRIPPAGRPWSWAKVAGLLVAFLLALLQALPKQSLGPPVIGLPDVQVAAEDASLEVVHDQTAADLDAGAGTAADASDGAGADSGTSAPDGGEAPGVADIASLVGEGSAD